MDNARQTLTRANIRYLLAILELDALGRGVRGIDLAARLGVAKSSVFTMTQNLLKLGLVEKASYGAIFLTPPGRQRAERYAEYYAVILRRLKSAFGCADADCQSAAYDLLANMGARELSLLQTHPQ